MALDSHRGARRILQDRRPGWSWGERLPRLWSLRLMCIVLNLLCAGEKTAPNCGGLLLLRDADCRLYQSLVCNTSRLLFSSRVIFYHPSPSNYTPYILLCRALAPLALLLSPLSAFVFLRLSFMLHCVLRPTLSGEMSLLMLYWCLDAQAHPCVTSLVWARTSMQNGEALTGDLQVIHSVSRISK